MNSADIKKIQALLVKPKSKPEKPSKTKVRTRQAVCMNLTEDRIAAQLLGTFVGIYKSRKRKGTKLLSRLGKEWIAMGRDEWAEAANLGPGQIKNRALPILKERCSSFLDVRAMKLSPGEPLQLWMSIDLVKMQEALTPWDVYDAFAKGGGITIKKATYPYKNAS